jgi:hypothetical protein
MNILMLISSLIGCGTKSVEDSSTPIDTDTDTDTDTSVVDTDVSDPCEMLEGVEGYRFEGRVEYEDGTPAKDNVRVQMCSSSCFAAKWGDDGGFCFRRGALSPGVYSFDTVPTTGEANTYATPLSFVEIKEDDDIIQLADAVIIPTFTNSQEASMGDFDAGGGLTLNVDDSSFTEETVHSVVMDPASAGLPLEGFSDRTIIGMWYFGPFNEVTGDNPWSFTVANLQLNVGDQIQIYNASYDDHDWIDVGTATVDEDGLLVSDENSGLVNLSVMLLVQ